MKYLKTRTKIPSKTVFLFLKSYSFKETCVLKFSLNF